MPSPKRRGSPRQPARRWRCAKCVCTDVVAAAHLGAVHDVVVHEREGVHELERGRRVDHTRIVAVAVGADERAVAERRAQPLAAGGDEAAQRLDRLGQADVDRAPPRELGREQIVDPALDRAANGMSAVGNTASFGPVEVMPGR